MPDPNGCLMPKRGDDPGREEIRDYRGHGRLDSLELTPMDLSTRRTQQQTHGDQGFTPSPTESAAMIRSSGG